MCTRYKTNRQLLYMTYTHIPMGRGVIISRYTAVTVKLLPPVCIACTVQ